MKTLQDILNFAGITNHNITLASVENDVTSWGRTGRSSRPKDKYTVWFDAPDNNDRIVISFSTVLTPKRTAPEKRMDLNIQVSHYSIWDDIKRTFTESHPERWVRIDGMLEDGLTRTIWKEVAAITNGMKEDPKQSFMSTHFFTS